MLSRFRLNFSRCLKTVSAFAALTILILLFNLQAFAAAGDLDASFGQNGVTAPTGLNFAFATTVTLQPDGKIIVGGTAAAPSFPGFALVRYLPNGAIDTSFGTNGRVVTPLSSTGTSLNDVAVLPDGKIVAAGYIRVPDTETPFAQHVLLVIRYNANGSIDTTFNGDGRYIYAEGGVYTSAEQIAVLPDGKFLVAGYTGAAIKGNVPYKALLFRFAGDGLDSTFGSGGIVITQVAGETQTHSMALQPDGKIVVGGKTTSDFVFCLSVARYNADGTIDTSFGNNGRVIRPNETSSQAVEVLIQPNGKIVAVALQAPQSDGSQVAVFRLNSNGSPDTSFGTNGKVVTDVSDRADAPNAGALQADGKIIVAGYGYNVNTGSGFVPFLIRYNPDGTLDRTFGIGGIARTPSGALLHDTIIQPDGKILAVGNPFATIDAPGFYAVRYLAHGARDFDFDGDRKADVSVFRPNSAAEWYWLNSSNGQSSGLQFGIGADKIVPTDYDGDGKTDISVFRSGIWYRLNSSNNQFVAAQFGQSGDIPVPADFDGDARADLAVYRQGFWYILNSADNSFRAAQFGISTDKPVIGDFDGDGKTDLAVYRDGIWYQMRSRQGFYAEQFGIGSDKPAPADYDSDGKTDLAVFRPSDGVWYLQRSHLGFTAMQFGISTDRATPADYDNDGKADIAVYRDGNWYLQQSTAGFRAVQFGISTDVPVPSAFLP